MNNNRRNFLLNSSLLATGYLLAKPFKAVAGVSANSFFSGDVQPNAVAIAHTNDLHGRLNAFNYGELNNIGGLYNIHAVINHKISGRILVDAGNFLGNSGAFSDNLTMISQMNKAGYTAVTIGERELAMGEDNLASLAKHMHFKMVNCNYSFSNAELKAKVVPYHIVRHGSYKIGITAVGVLPANKEYAKGISVSDPYKKANEVAGYLKNQQNCDLVICLAHLGPEKNNGSADNRGFAAASKNIDIIIGGNNKTITHPQVIAKNSEKQQVVISSGGYGGTMLGTVTFEFNSNKQMQNFNCKNYVPGTAAGSSFYDNYKKLTA